MNLFTQFQSFPEFIHSRQARNLAQVVVIAGVLLVSLILALLASDRILLMAFGAIIALAGLLLLINFPGLGLLITILGGVTVAYSGPGGVNLTVMGIIATTGLWVVDLFVKQRRLELVQSRTNLAVFVFLIIAVVSFFIGQVPWYPSMPQAPLTAQAGGLAIFLLSGLAFLLVGNIVKSTGWLKALLVTILFVGVVYMTGRLFPAASLILRRYYQSGFTTGSLFWVWLTVLPYSQALFNTRMKKGVRAALLGFVMLVMYVAIFDGGDWKSGYIPPLAGLGVITAFWLGKRVWLLIPLVPVGVWYVATQALESDVYSASTRLEAWKIVSQLSLTNPFLGLGFANYYWYTPIIPIGGWYVNFNSHSQYVDILAQTGIIGLLCVFWVFWSVGKLGWGLRSRVDEGFPRAYVYGVLGGLAGTIVAGFFVDWFLPFVYNIGMNGFRASVLSWIFMGGLVSLENMLNQRAVSKNE